MPTSLVSTGVTFPNNLTQTTSFQQPVALGASYGGGFYIGSLYMFGYPFHIVASPIANQSTGRQWKTTNTATSDLIDGLDGNYNTVTHLNNATHPAGQYCRGLNINGFTDWYLPSFAELNLMWYSQSALGASQRNSGSRASGVRYWSSSETHESGVWGQNFPIGDRINLVKTNSFYVRAVRRVAI